jgi:hypothetical protein
MLWLDVTDEAASPGRKAERNAIDSNGVPAERRHARIPEP